MKITSPVALLAADTDRTQDYVFESARLPEIRGASRQLDDLNHRLGDWVQGSDPEAYLIYATGGSLLALAPPDKAQILAERIEALYPQETTVATITAAWREINAEMLQQGYPPSEAPFGSLTKWAGTWLRRRKESRETHPFIEALPHTERCRSCQIRPVDPQTVAWDWPLCHVCLNKRRYARRDEWFGRFEQYLTPQQAKDYYNGAPVACAYPQDLSELGAACVARPGYVGFIYLDGDDMGQVFADARSPEDAHCLSEIIHRASEGAVWDALVESGLHPAEVAPSLSHAERGGEPAAPEQMVGERVRIHPFEVITIGGDDIILIVPADRVIPVACAISRGFQARMAQALAAGNLPENIRDKKYTLSGGVVIASDHNPVRVLRDLARELKASAKRSRRAAQATEGYLDFLTLKSADMVERSIEQMRERYPYSVAQPGEKPLRLLGRPYAVSKLMALWEKLIKLGQAGRFARSQMHQLVESLLRGRHESTLFYLYQRARHPTPYQFLDEALAEVQGSDPHNPTPWVQCRDAAGATFYRTSLWDFAELYDFVAGTPVQEETP